ncbi:MAG: hypothetical protein NZM38_06430 [Cytophagales bacterium]|nr:hypothetical protein [Cytophagales bacterium]MDW8384392.1 OstA-like protein [Flammeovirgaceae bacterium]
MPTIFKRLLPIIGLFFPVLMQAQETSISEESNVVMLQQAAELEVVREQGKELRYVKSDSARTKRVIFTQGSMTLQCWEAIQNPIANEVRAYGEVVFTQGDSVTLNGDTAVYNGFTKIAEVWGQNVVLFTDSLRLITDRIRYNRLTGIAWYENGGRLEDDSTTLTSLKGYYNTATKLMTFKTNVQLENPSQQSKLISDTLIYDTQTKKSFFVTKTYIYNEDRVLIANRGTYDNNSGQADFEENASIDHPEYIMFGDYLNYNKNTQQGFGRGNIRLYSKKDTVSIYGQKGFFDREKKFAKVWENALMEKPFGKDTLLLQADTLISVFDTLSDERFVKAYYHVKICSQELQAICDSLFYNYADSTIHFFNEPILWNIENQITGDTVKVQLKGKEIDTIHIWNNAFVVSVDSIGNFNQIKGREMICRFQENQIKRIDVNGNGQCIYFALDNDSILLGMNSIVCSNIVVLFGDSNKVQSITFLYQPEAKFIPPHEIEEPDKYLKGFAWHHEKRPPKDSLRALLNEYLSKIPPLPVQEKRQAKFVLEQKGNEIELRNTLCFEEDLKGTFYVDFVPKDIEDLSPSHRLKGYETITFTIPPQMLKDNRLYYRIKLPRYEVATARVGQFKIVIGEDGRPVRQEVWADFINFW